MKYQQLENLESGWKCDYLVKKIREGENILSHLEEKVADVAIQELLQMQSHPVQIEPWIKRYINGALEKRLRQTIRARRKRYFNAELPSTRKKSIDLEFFVWQRLASYAHQSSCTLSEAIAHLLDSSTHHDKYHAWLSDVKQEIHQLLKSAT